MTETIQQLKEDIAILQEKLRKLQEPQMTLKKSGEVDIVSYNHKYYFRLSFGVGDFQWYKRYIGSSNLMPIDDHEEHRLVEELYDDTMLDTGVVEEQGTWNYDPDAKFRKQEEVKKLQEKEWKVDVKTDLKPHSEKRKLDDLAEKLLPDDHPYKITDEHGETNPYKQYLNSVKEWKPKPQNENEVAEGLKSAFREAIKEGIIPGVDKVSDKFMDEMVAELKGQTLTDIIWTWWNNVFTSNEDWDAENCIEHLVDLIEAFLPKPQSAAGSQNAYVECSVEGYNDCLKKIKSKLRNKK